ncbi:MAG: NAD-dependent deacylase [Candidatus Coatesbacteria bacterium]|nr:MAG: NAD-dependent deacylase [Candidatus Coatesbacteria bacterium]
MPDDRLNQITALGGAVVVLTGAGVSAESGVPTFRGEDGLWRTYRAEDLATPHAFAADPHLVWEWYQWRRELVAACRPNPAHEFIARLEREHGGEFLLVTQNVDGLHRLAGSEKLVEVHGNLWKVGCTSCGRSREDRTVPFPELPPRCDECGGLLRPGVVWFGEALPEAPLARALAAAERCELMLVVGTSAVVYPVAYLPQLARRAGAHVIEVNSDETPLTPLVDESWRGKAGEVLGKRL